MADTGMNPVSESLLAAYQEAECRGSAVLK